MMAAPEGAHTMDDEDNARMDELIRTSSVELDDGMLAELAAFGVVRDTHEGEVLYEAGAVDPEFFVVLEGEAVVTTRATDGGADIVIVSHGPRRFLGELNLLTGQRAL